MPRVDRNAPAVVHDVGTQLGDNSVATVRLGETTLSDVAKRLNVDSGALLDANLQIADRTRLKIGQEIRLSQFQTWQTQGQDSAPLTGNQPSAPDQAGADGRSGGEERYAGDLGREDGRHV